MTNNVFCEYKYAKKETEESSIIPQNLPSALIDYYQIVKNNKGKTLINNIKVIDMDKIKESLKINPTPSSMDMAFVAKKQERNFVYFLLDLKFDISSPKEVIKNIPNESIKNKYEFTRSYIQEKDDNINVNNTAYFVFKNKDFEIVKNLWSRRNLNKPSNVAVSQNDFKKVFREESV